MLSTSSSRPGSTLSFASAIQQNDSEQDASQMSYATAWSSRPGSSSSFAPAQKNASDIDPTELELSYPSASTSRPSSSLSDFPALGSRPTSGLSSNRYSGPAARDGFCQVPIPGLGRGSRNRKVHN